jgi:oxygen-independent coproporphyrinogen-3 oxidase
LEKEFDFIGRTGIGRRKVRQYHWGGGTPTQLNLAQMERVQRAFLRNFQLATDAEIAIEVDPRVTTTEQVRWLADQGFNRVSLGVQDFDLKVQEAIARVQSEEQTRVVIDAARDAGIRSINIDLIYGLPHQTVDSFRRTIERVIDIRPERVALFHYAHVPWMKKHQTALETDATPDAATKLAIFQMALAAFSQGGWRCSAISWATPRAAAATWCPSVCPPSARSMGPLCKTLPPRASTWPRSMSVATRPTAGIACPPRTGCAATPSSV